MSLGVARRLVEAAAMLLGDMVDTHALWQDWSGRGIPGAVPLANLCFARTEEHRWRAQSMQQDGEEAATLFDTRIEAQDAVGTPGFPRLDDPISDIDRAYLWLRIADGRRFDAVGQPCIAIDDLDEDQMRKLLLDIAAWQLVRSNNDEKLAGRLGEGVRNALMIRNPVRGIDHAGSIYNAALLQSGTLLDSAAAAIARHDWPTVIALAAAAQNCRFGDMALALVAAEPAQLASLLAPLLHDLAMVAPLEASLARVPNRATAGAMASDLDAALKERAATIGAGLEGRK